MKLEEKRREGGTTLHFSANVKTVVLLRFIVLECAHNLFEKTTVGFRDCKQCEAECLTFKRYMSLLLLFIYF